MESVVPDFDPVNHLGVLILWDLIDVASATNGTGLELHDVTCQGPCLVTENVLDLPQLFHQTGGSNHRWSVCSLVYDKLEESAEILITLPNEETKAKVINNPNKARICKLMIRSTEVLLIGVAVAFLISLVSCPVKTTIPWIQPVFLKVAPLKSNWSGFKGSSLLNRPNVPSSLSDWALLKSSMASFKAETHNTISNVMMVVYLFVGDTSGTCWITEVKRKNKLAYLENSWKRNLGRKVAKLYFVVEM
ncbi:hypothetical protein WICPIJ_007477 [Wickerhamomyces pijperi]|uniref:Uncharacterized protein n=1 Tax=Wickerhamomyces pijperi TaxID=599730 RepID=A0A9P8TJ98_WICPI|nr:hypothetical protein WICPIJ_007477 [Wickerhamomyces pijperi]